MKVWAVATGKRPTCGFPATEISVKQAQRLLLLKDVQFLCGIDKIPKFRRDGDNPNLDEYRGPEFTVLEISEAEAREADLKKGAGFYRSSLSWRDAEAALRSSDLHGSE